MHSPPPGTTRYLCPLECGWYHDEPPPTAERVLELADPPGIVGMSASALSLFTRSAFYREAQQREQELREHLATHTTDQFVTAIQHLLSEVRRLEHENTRLRAEEPPMPNPEHPGPDDSMTVPADAPVPDYRKEQCPHCDEWIWESLTDGHIATAHADIPPCTASINHGLGPTPCALRAGHRSAYDNREYWHASARHPIGRTVWTDTAAGATPHKEQPDA